jgi:hypothetical protein
MVRKLNTPINLPTSYFLPNQPISSHLIPIHTNPPTCPRTLKHLSLHFHLHLHLHSAIVSVPCRFASDTHSASFPLSPYHI